MAAETMVVGELAAVNGTRHAGKIGLRQDPGGPGIECDGQVRGTGSHSRLACIDEAFKGFQ